jgi:hypothetical protein
MNIYLRFALFQPKADIWCIDTVILQKLKQVPEYSEKMPLADLQGYTV